MEQNKEKDSDRLISLDALRGFDMFWIIGGDALFHALAKYTHWPVIKLVGRTIDSYVVGRALISDDMIFPLFLIYCWCDYTIFHQ